MIKRMIKLDDYKNCLLNDEIVLKSQQDLKAKDTMYTQKILIK